MYSLFLFIKAKRLFIFFFIFISSVSFSQITLPIEVFDYTAGAHTVSVDFSLSNANQADGLYLKIHRPVYRDVSTNPDRGAKISVKLNNGTWIDLTNDNVTCYPHEAAYGGLNGTYHTIRMTVPIANAVSGNNTLHFRYNGTDGFTTGFRVLDFNIRSGTEDLIAPSVFINEDPSKWKPIYNDSQRIAEGKALWESETLIESPLSNSTLRAKCASCHATDGRDLKYFNYSNESIIKRSQFHKLSKEEGEKIASYIRSLNTPAPAKGRPWNPPYQPGPDLDSKPVEEWSAGAGLEAILEDDDDIIEEAFNGAITEENIAQVFNIENTQNARETRISIQFPDWNEWLPAIHPLDVPRIGDKFTDVPVHRIGGENEPIYTTYVKTVELLNTNDINELIEDGRLKEQLNNLANQATNLSDVLSKAYGHNPSSKEDLVEHLMKWGAAKTWEIMQTYNLEDKAPVVHGDYGEPRSWLSTRRNVFEIAPHRAANNLNNFAHQDILTGKYFSTAWYHLQLVINGGNRNSTTLWPVDWNYQPDHIASLHRFGGPAHPFRYVISHAKMFQLFNDSRMVGAEDPSKNSAIGFRQIHPGRYVNGNHLEVFKDLDSSLRVKFLEGMLNATMDLIDTVPIEDWPRSDRATDEPASNNELRVDTYIPVIFPIEQMSGQIHRANRADAWMTMIPGFRDLGVGEPTLNRLINWGQSMWPLGDWDAVTNFFTPDTSKNYYIDVPEHNLRLGATGSSENPFTTSTTTTGVDVEWKFVSKGNGSWHIDRADGGSLPRLRTRNNGGETDMQATSSSGYYTYWDITPGAFNNTYFLTLPDFPDDKKRLQIDPSGQINMVPLFHNGSWESFTFTEVEEKSDPIVVHITKRNATGFAIDGNWGGANGQNVYLWDNNENNINQQWIEIDRGNGYYSYQKIGTNYAIDGNREGFNGQNVHLWEINENNHNQHWQKVDVGDGAYKLIKRSGSGFALDGGDGGDNRQNITLRNSTSTSQNLHWFITPIEGVSAKSLEITDTQEIVLYPNPVQSIVTIQGAANATIRVYDMNGKTMLTKNSISESETLDLSALSAGIYYAQVNRLQGTKTLKIVKQ